MNCLSSVTVSMVSGAGSLMRVGDDLRCSTRSVMPRCYSASDAQDVNVANPIVQ